MNRYLEFGQFLGPAPKGLKNSARGFLTPSRAISYAGWERLSIAEA
jgi:hypothetical protein